MSAEEMKAEAIKEIAKLNSEETLKEVLNYLSEINSRNNDTINLSKHYDKVTAKYSNVMQKLAQ